MKLLIIATAALATAKNAEGFDFVRLADTNEFWKLDGKKLVKYEPAKYEDKEEAVEVDDEKVTTTKTVMVEKENYEFPELPSNLDHRFLIGEEPIRTGYENVTDFSTGIVSRKFVSDPGNYPDITVETLGFDGK